MKTNSDYKRIANMLYLLRSLQHGAIRIGTAYDIAKENGYNLIIVEGGFLLWEDDEGVDKK